MPSVIPPSPTLDDQFFWDAIAQGRLVFRRCSACGVVRHPPAPMCGECRSVELLVVNDPGDRRDENNPDPAPDSISDADRNRTERHRQAIEGKAVPEDDNDRGQRTRKAVRHLEKRGRKDFAQYREREPAGTAE